MESGDFPVPVLHLKFGENTGAVIYDSSPEGNDGTISGATWAKGWLGSGIDFDGLDNKVTIPDAPSLDLTGAFSVVYRIKTDTDFIMGGSGNEDIGGKGNAWLHRISHDYGNGYFYVWDKDGGEHILASDILNLYAGNWYQLVYLYDGTYLRLYKNATPAGTENIGTIIVRTNDVSVAFGWWTGYFAGVLDEVRIYDLALTARQILELYYSIE